MRKSVIPEDVNRINELAEMVLCEKTYDYIERLGGLTNHTYKLTMSNNENYVIRIPGDGTEELINRVHEKISTQLACRLGIDASMLYFGENGEKVTCYINDARTMSPESMRDEENVVKVAGVLRKLHSCKENTRVPFEVFDMALSYEKIIKDNKVALYEDYDSIKNKIMQIKDTIDQAGISEKVPCHNDPLCENWILSGAGQLYLIDWEYAGMNDGMWDLADVSIESGYSSELDQMLLEAYLEHEPSVNEKERFEANKLYLDFLWTLWGKARVPFDGDAMEAYAAERYERLKKNLWKFEKAFEVLTI